MGVSRRQSRRIENAGVLKYARLGGAQLAIGAAAIFARFALGGAGPFAIAALRLAIASAAVALVTLVARGVRPLGLRREVAFAAAGGALAVHFAAWIASLSYTSVALSTLLVTTTPIWTEAFECFRKRRYPTRTFVLAAICAFGGVAAIAFARTPAHLPIPGHGLFGDALALLGSLAIGAYLTIVRDAGGRGDARIPTRAIVLRTYAWATLALTLAALVMREPPPPASALGAWAGIGAMAVISQLLGHTALNAALRDFTPSIVALTTLLEPIVAAALAALIFGETLSLWALAGALLVLGAIGAVLRDDHGAALGELDGPGVAMDMPSERLSV